MDFTTTLGLVGVVLAIVSLVYAVYVTRANRREKELVYDVLPPSPLAQVIARESGYSIKILYEQPGQAPEQLDSVFVQYLRFGNIGRVPIMSEDIVDPIRIQIDGARVLDIAVASTKRDLSNISIGPPLKNGETYTAELKFKFLDYGDGGLMQIVTDEPPRDVTMSGEVLVMPSGIRRVELNSQSRRIAWPFYAANLTSLIIAIVLFVYVTEHYFSGFYHLIPNGYVAFATGAIGGFIMFALVTTVLYGIKMIWRRANELRESSVRNALLEPPKWYSKRTLR